MSDELQPCPFCGGEPSFCYDPESQFYFVRCTDCDAQTKSSQVEYPQGMVEVWRLGWDKWNRRI